MFDLALVKSYLYCEKKIGRMYNFVPDRDDERWAYWVRSSGRVVVLSNSVDMYAHRRAAYISDRLKIVIDFPEVLVSEFPEVQYAWGLLNLTGDIPSVVTLKKIL